MRAAPIAVYGATGHTGRLAAEALAAGEHPVVLGGRDRGALDQFAARLGSQAAPRTAGLEDQPGLARLLEGCGVLVNCAGPFVETAAPLIEAALRSRVDYVDVCAEPLQTVRAFERYDAEARQRGVTVMPSMSFYFAVGDLLAREVAGGSAVDAVEVAYWIENWKMTAASRAAANHVARQPRPTYEGGRLQVSEPSLTAASFSFPQRGETPVITYPGAEPLLIPRHVQTPEVKVWMATEPMATWSFDAANADPGERAESRFTVVAEATRSGRAERSSLRGEDIYLVGARLAAAAAVELTAAGRPAPGVIGPAEGFELRSLMQSCRTRLGAPQVELQAGG